MARRQRTSDVIHELAKLLRENGDKILDGSSKLSLTTTSLAILSDGFARICDLDPHQMSFEVVNTHNAPLPVYQDLEFLHDFIQKTASLKIIHGTHTLQGRVRINEFRALTSLELKKVPIHLLEGLHKLRGKLVTLTCSRSLHVLQDLLETCGGDMSPPLTWSALNTAILSFNSIEELDTSFRLLPKLEFLDLGHNNLKEVDSHLEYLTDLRHINLGFNCLEIWPSFSMSCKQRLVSLVLRNNKLESINGAEEMTNLKELDLAFNCLVSHNMLIPLHCLHNLTKLNVAGNPLSYDPQHRLALAGHVSNKFAGRFILDGKPFTEAELVHKRKNTNFLQSSLNSAIVPAAFGESLSADTSMYAFSASYNIARPHSARKKKRKQKLLRRAIEHTDSEYTDSPPSSRPNTPSPPSSRSNTPWTSLSKEQFEKYREEFGSNWLMALPTSTLNSCRSSGADPTENVALNKPKETEDDIYLNEKEFGTRVHQSEGTRAQEKLSSQGNEVAVNECFESESNCDRRCCDESSEDPKGSSGGSQTLVWRRSESIERDVLENESEPFIVTNSYENLLVSVCSRNINEKDLEGNIRDQLDLRCLLSAEEAPDKDSRTCPVVKLVFDYVRKDRKERTYIMEDVVHAEEFLKLLKPHIDNKRMSRSNDLQCLKCSAQFSDRNAHMKVKRSRSPKMQHSNLPLSASDKGFYSEVRICPNCKSELIVELNDVNVSEAKTTSSDTPIGSVSSESGYLPLATSSAKSTPFKKLHAANSTSSGKGSESYTSCNESVNESFQTCNEITPPPGDESIPPPPGWQHSQSTLVCNVNSSDFSRSNKSVNEQDVMVVKKSLIFSDKPGAPDKLAPQDHTTGLAPHSIRSRTMDSEGHSTGRYNSAGSDILIISDSSHLTSASTQELSHSAPDDQPVANSLTLNPVEELSLTSNACQDMLSSVYKNSIPNNDRIRLGKTEDIQQEGVENNMMRTCTDDGKRLADVVKQFIDLKENDVLDSPFEQVASEQISSFTVPQQPNQQCSLLAEPDHIAFSYGDFSLLDHRLKLFLDMHILKDEEDCEILLKCPMVRASEPEEVSGMIIVTNQRFYICRIKGRASSNIAEWLRVVDVLPVSEIVYVQIGLCHQKIRLDFDSGVGTTSLALLVRDELRCKSFLSMFTMFLHKHTDATTKLRGINKSNAAIHEAISTLLCVQCGMKQEEYRAAGSINYYLAHQRTSARDSADEAILQPVTVIVTENVICLCVEDHSSVSGRDPLELLDCQKIVNLTQIITYEKRPTEITLDIEDSSEAWQCHIVMETQDSVISLANALKLSWEREFEVTMDIITN